MKILIDVSLSPQWRSALEAAGHEVVYWLDVGDQFAPDHEIMQWAAANGYVVFTHDLDFGAILAAIKSAGPSVIQVRADEILPDALEGVVAAAIDDFAEELRSGAIVVVEPHRARVRILPID